jgi:hypothetical protein
MDDDVKRTLQTSLERLRNCHHATNKQTTTTMREPSTTTKKKKANVDASKPHEARENDTPEFVKKQIELAMMAVLEKRGAEKTC